MTGSTHTVMAPYWGERLRKDKMVARQCSRRGGEMGLLMRKDEGRLEISGQAVIFMSGFISV